MCEFYGFGGASECRELRRDYHLLAHLMASVPPSTDGMWLEFGVYKGTSLNMTADAKRRLIVDLNRASERRFRLRSREDAAAVHGFDSFQGLPENWTIVRATQNVNKRHVKCECSWAKHGTACGNGDGSRCWVACCGPAGGASTSVLAARVRDAPVTQHTVAAGSFSLDGHLPAVVEAQHGARAAGVRLPVRIGAEQRGFQHGARLAIGGWL